MAISALVSRYQAATRDQYIAGLWRPGLESDLTWKSTFDDSAKELLVTKALRPVRYTAPTWSWAYLQAELLSSIVDVKFTASGQNMCGQVASTFIRIRCHQLRRAAVSDATPDREDAFPIRGTSYYMTGNETDKRWPEFLRIQKPVLAFVRHRSTGTS